MQQRIMKIGERATCRDCGRTIVYVSAGWMHVRTVTGEYHMAVPAAQPAIIEDALAKALERVVELESILAVRDARITTLLAENAKLAEKVRR